MKKATRITMASLRFITGAVIWWIRCPLAVTAGFVSMADGIVSAAVNSHASSHSWWAGFKFEAKAAVFYGMGVINVMLSKASTMIRTGLEALSIEFA